MIGLQLREESAELAEPARWTGAMLQEINEKTQASPARRRIPAVPETFFIAAPSRFSQIPITLFCIIEGNTMTKMVEIEVFARCKWNDTQLDIVRGQTVRIIADGRWIDSSIPASPEGFEKPWLNLVRFTRRLPSAPWFCLCATVDRMKRPIHRIGKLGEFVAGRDGRLYLFANDAWLFYGNNKGYISATVEVVD